MEKSELEHPSPDKRTFVNGFIKSITIFDSNFI